MAAIYSSFLEMRQFDDKGLLLADGWMSFYQAGETTLANIYADAQGTPLANPVQLNGAGTAIIFGDQVAYRIEIRDSLMALVYEVDNVFPFGQGASGTGAGTVGVALNYNGVRNLSQDYNVVLVCGAVYGGDGGEGTFYKSSTTAPDNNGTVLTHGATRYTRQYSGLVDPRWFGVQYSTPTDQSSALDAALSVGTVQIAGELYLGQDYHMGGSIFVLSGGFYTNVTPKLFLEGTIVQGAPSMFGTGIEVHMEAGVCDAIRTSWFTSMDQALCTTFAYDFIVDKQMFLVALKIPYNYTVDFASGAVLTVGTGISTDISIANLVYSGNSQIIKYNNIQDVGQVDFGDTFCLLEWFGGVSGYAAGVDNRIAARAALQSGRLRLAAPYYKVAQQSSTAWTTGKDLQIVGAVSSDTLDLYQSVTVLTWTQTDCVVTGGTTITSTGLATIENAQIMGMQECTPASTEQVLASAYVPGVYTAVGQNGMIRNSNDLLTWSAATGITDSISSIAKGVVWVATGQGGRIWKSIDGGVTWASQTVASVQLNFATVIAGTYILVGNGGVVYTSADAISWNAHFVTTTSNLESLVLHPSTGLYVVVGTAGFVATSPDLITWTTRPLPSTVTGDLLTVVAGPAGLVASGSLAGLYLRSTDAATWESFTLADSTTIYASAVATDTTAGTLVLTGANGKVYVSTDSGVTFSSQLVAANSPILSIAWSQGDWLLGTLNGIVYHSSDIKTFSFSYVGVGNDVSAVYVSAPIYVLAGQQNSLQVSSDSINWKLAVPDSSTQDWHGVRLLNGLIWLLGGQGRLFATMDMVSFRQIPTGITNDLYDITWNATAEKYTICGANGYVASAPNLSVANPAWTIGTAVTADTLIRAIWNSPTYTFASSSSIVTSPDAVTLTLQKPVINGIVSTGTMWIQFGNSGAIYTSTDMIDWEPRISGTTQNLLAGIYQGGTIILVGANGTCLRSTDGIAWSSVSVGATNQINAITWNAGAGALGIACSGAKAYSSSNLGASWTSIYSGTLTQDFLSIWARGSEWDICGDGAIWIYSPDGVTWTQRTMPSTVTANLWAGQGDCAVGDTGTLIALQSGSVVDLTALHGLTANFRRFLLSVLLDSSGQLWVTNSTLGFVAQAQSSSPSLRSLGANGTTVYAVGDILLEAAPVTNYEIWTKDLAQFTGIHDVVLDPTSLDLYAVGDNGFYARSKNGVMWNYLGAQTWNDTNSYKSVAFYQAGGYNNIFSGINTMAQGTAAVIAGTSIYSGAGLSLPSINFNQANATDATSNVPWLTMQPGTIESSALFSVLNFGAVADSSFSLLGAGGAAGAYGNIVRSELTLSTTLNIVSNIRISECSLTKTLQTDHASLPLLAVGGSTLGIGSSSIETNGALVVSGSACTVALADCTNSSNFAFALCNGLAKISLDRCGTVRNTTAYSIDGSTLDDAFAFLADTILTAATTNWQGPALGQITSDGTNFVVNSPIGLSADYASANTLRLLLSDAIVNLGGRLKVQVQYPEATAPVDVALVATIVHSATSINDAGGGGTHTVSQSIESGLATPWHSNTAGEAVTTWTNVWAGFTQTLHHWVGPTTDIWGGSIPVVATPYNANYLVLKNVGTGIIPAGTKIEVSLVHSLPYENATYQRFFNQAQSAADTLQALPFSLHAFSHVERTSNEIQTQVIAAGSLVSMQQWLSQNSAGTIDTWGVGGESAYYVPAFPTNKKTLFPFITKANGINRLRIWLQSLVVLNHSDANWGGWAPGLVYPGQQFTPESMEISNDTWFLDTSLSPSAFTF